MYTNFSDLTCSPMLAGLTPSRLLKLPLPRLADDAPLMAVPGTSLPECSGRIRTVPLQWRHCECRPTSGFSRISIA